jgi:3-phenylpropionate/trans-cinnamate dioxygenase ferredoxin reductase subunit
MGGPRLNVVIIGAGQAGVQVAQSLRQLGHDGRIMLIGDEPHLPYQRPPLSKAYLKAGGDLSIRPEQTFATLNIELIRGERAQKIDRAARTVSCAVGTLSYDRLVLATGTRPRQLQIPGSGLRGILSLRSIEDADRLTDALAKAQNVAIIGGGFIGLEVATTARAMGKSVTVLEAAGRVMARAVAPQISSWFETMHRNMGTDVRCGAGVAELQGDGGVEAVLLADGTRIAADLVLVGIGALPNIEIAATADLPCPNGIATDERGATQDPLIFAAGDCALTPSPWAAVPVRLESVQNAIDQGKTVAAALMGQDARYEAVPWFWSDQGTAKLQTTGLPVGADSHLLRGNPADGRFTVFHLRDGRLIAADSVNSPADHMAARRLVAARTSFTPEHLVDPAVSLKSLIS